MECLDWLHFLILVFAVFSIAYAITKEAAVYFSGKSHLSKWILYVLLSAVVVLLKFCVPFVFPYLIIFAVAGGAEMLSSFTDLIKGGARLNYSKENVKTSEALSSVLAAGKDESAGKRAAVGVNASSSGTRIINDGRVYGQDEFLKESRGRKMILSSYLRSSLVKAKDTQNNKPKDISY